MTATVHTFPTITDPPGLIEARAAFRSPDKMPLDVLDTAGPGKHEKGSRQCLTHRTRKSVRPRRAMSPRRSTTPPATSKGRSAVAILWPTMADAVLVAATTTSAPSAATPSALNGQTEPHSKGRQAPAVPKLPGPLNSERNGHD